MSKKNILIALCAGLVLPLLNYILSPFILMLAFGSIVLVLSHILLKTNKNTTTTEHTIYSVMFSIGFGVSYFFCSKNSSFILIPTLFAVFVWFIVQILAVIATDKENKPLSWWVFLLWCFCLALLSTNGVFLKFLQIFYVLAIILWVFKITLTKHNRKDSLGRLTIVLLVWLGSHSWISYLEHNNNQDAKALVEKVQAIHKKSGTYPQTHQLQITNKKLRYNFSEELPMLYYRGEYNPYCVHRFDFKKNLWNSKCSQ